MKKIILSIFILMGLKLAVAISIGAVRGGVGKCSTSGGGSNLASVVKYRIGKVFWFKKECIGTIVEENSKLMMITPTSCVLPFINKFGKLPWYNTLKITNVNNPDLNNFMAQVNSSPRSSISYILIPSDEKIARIGIAVLVFHHSIGGAVGIPPDIIDNPMLPTTTTQELAFITQYVYPLQNVLFNGRWLWMINHGGYLLLITPDLKKEITDNKILVKLLNDPRGIINIAYEKNKCALQFTPQDLGAPVFVYDPRSEIYRQLGVYTGSVTMTKKFGVHSNLLYIAPVNYEHLAMWVDSCQSTEATSSICTYSSSVR